MFGYQGKILHVDLSERTSRVEEFDEAFARKYLGGNGFAARILWDRVGPATDPLSPESAVVLAVGPYTDTPIPSASRACVAAKSPQTGLFCDGSFGGAWPVTLKRPARISYASGRLFPIRTTVTPLPGRLFRVTRVVKFGPAKLRIVE